MVEAEQVENLEFKWGRKRGIGGKKKDVQFYESFTYDGVDYALYDSVYLYKEGESEPYVGKLIKIWENPDKAKKVKILWFFRPCEILNFLGSEDTPSNELFLASGDGVGLANVNALEAISGKCNVICISKDNRNPQPSFKDVHMADFVFYRTFDVGSKKILEKIGDKVASIEVKFLFNKVDPRQPDDEEVSRLEVTGAEAAVSSRYDSRDENVTLRTNGNEDNFPNGDSQRSKYGPCDAVEKDRINKSQCNDIKNHVREVNSAERVNCSFDNGVQDQRPSKKARFDSSFQLSVDKKKNNTQKLDHHSRVNTTNSADVSDSHEVDEILTNKLRPGENPTKLYKGKVPETSFLTISNKDNKVDTQEVEVTRRPGADRSKWFKGLPWEERLKTAHDQGTLVLLQNLDPDFISMEVEDLVWHAFNESCTAKMIQSTAFSSPHLGQAYVIFKTRDAAEKAITKLDEGCLLLSNGRPLVGRIGTPCFPTKKSGFFGHIVLDKQRLQLQRKDAVSTSHCSQPNTVEYDMALEWCLLQEKSDRAWEKLYKLQEGQLKKLKTILRSR